MCGVTKKLVALTILAMVTCLNFVYALDGAAVKREVERSSSLGSVVDLSIELKDQLGRDFRVGDLIKPGKPLVIVPVYYSCPRLCGLTLKGLTELMNRLNLTLRSDYSVLVASFNSEETPNQANRRAGEVKAELQQDTGDKDLVFSVGNEDQVSRLMGQIGFGYKKDGKDFAHGAALVVLTPNGKVSQFFSGIKYAPSDVRLALVDASQEKIGNLLDHIMLFCYRFDPLKGRYTFAAWNFARFGSLLFVILFGSLVYYYVRKKA